MEMYIPKTITVGFRERSETFTGKLAYVIYTDDKGVLRKEQSWKSWRDPEIAPITFENTPSNGFTFNKGITRDGYGWGSGRSVIRVYDSRDFEFEVSVDNLVGILMHSDVSKRDIQEECVYAWHGKDLVLLPVNSDDYRKSIEYTKKIETKFSAKELVIGRTYSAKREPGEFIYIGRMDRYEWISNYLVEPTEYSYKHKGKKHVFMESDGRVSIFEPSTQISSCINEEICQDYANLYQKYLTTPNSSNFIEFKFVKLEISDIRITTYNSTISGLTRKHSNKYVNMSCYKSSWQTVQISEGYEVDLKDKTFTEKPRHHFYRVNESASINEIVMAILTKPHEDITDKDLHTLYDNGYGKIVGVYENDRINNL